MDGLCPLADEQPIQASDAGLKDKMPAKRGHLEGDRSARASITTLEIALCRGFLNRLTELDRPQKVSVV